MELRFINVSKEIKLSKGSVLALNDLSFTAISGDVTAIYGTNGSGKTTLLNLCSGLDSPTSGTILLNNKDISKMNKIESIKFYRSSCGCVYSYFNFIDAFSVLDNVKLARKKVKKPYNIKDILKYLNLEHLAKSYPRDLSNYEKQLLSIARALVKNPDIILCDEPIHFLELEDGIRILDILKNIAVDFNKIVLVATSNQDILSRFDAVYNL